MSVEIRELSLPDDLDRILTLHNANRQVPATRRRFEWAYLENPEGRARAWAAEDAGTLVGVAVVFPRCVRLPDGRRVRAWTTGDLSVSASHRRQGLASRLRVATRAAVDAGDSALLFAIPNAQAAGVHEKAGYWQLGRLERYVRLLALPGPPLVRELTRRPVQWFVRGCAAVTLPHRIAEHDVDDDVLFDVAALYERAAPGLGASVVRSVPYLRWRFLDNPRSPARLLIARVEGRTCAYAALVDRGASLYLRDWIVEDPETVPALVRLVVDHANALGKAWLSVSALEGHPHEDVLLGCGFRRRRDATDVKLYVPDSTPWRDQARTAPQWYLTGGDPDV